MILVCPRLVEIRLRYKVCRLPRNFYDLKELRQAKIVRDQMNHANDYINNLHEQHSLLASNA
jgi:hypothetical protein